MKLDDLDKVTSLRNQLAELAALREAAALGSFENDFGFWLNGRRYDAHTDIISHETIRQAVIHACADRMLSIGRQLRELGVAAPVQQPSQRDAEAWKQEADMYARAWLRELGGKVIQKPHLIDALVLTTQELREKHHASQQAIALFASCIKGGEAWSDACEQAYIKARGYPHVVGGSGGRGGRVDDNPWLASGATAHAARCQD